MQEKEVLDLKPAPRKITQDVRDYAATLNDKEQGMAQMSEKFRQLGSEVYVDAAAVRESNNTGASPDAASAPSASRSSLSADLNRPTPLQAAIERCACDWRDPPRSLARA
jgi:hypothetical protein